MRPTLCFFLAAASLLAQERPATAEEWQKLGLQRHLQNRFDEAIPAFSEAVRRKPSLWTSHLFLGIGRYRTNSFSAAVEALSRADRLAPAVGQGRDEVDYWLGAARIASGQSLGGLASLERLLARNSKHPDALQLATETYASASARLWNDVAERHFETAVGQHIHAQVLESEGDTANALEAYRQSRALNPKRPGPAAAIGRLLLAQRQPAEAVAALEAELVLAPHDGEAAHYAGLALIQLQRLPDAAARLTIAMQRLPGNPEPAAALAQVYLALGRPRDAVDAARAAVAAAPRLLPAHKLLLAALGAAGDTVAAQAEQARWQAISASQ